MSESNATPAESRELLDKLLAELDEIAPKAAKLTDAQRADLDRWRSEIRRLCEEGRHDEAKRAARLAVSLAWEGAPSKE